jgi:hypothetical protein
MTLTNEQYAHTVNSVCSTSQGGADVTRLLLVVAAAVGLGAALARTVVPDVTRYLRIRRM